MSKNEKKVKAPAKSKKNVAESLEAKSVVKAKAVAAETKPRAKTVKTKEVAEPSTAAASSGPQPVPSKAKSAQAEMPTHQQIAHLAHRLWKERGGHHGSHVQDWLLAETELSGKAS